MSVSSEIVRSWAGPGASLRRQLAAGATEGRALALLMAGCVFLFVAQWPRLAREAHLDPAIPQEALVMGAFQGIVIILPLLLYGVAALSHLAARALGGQGTWFSARLALFWTLLASAPLFLLHGLVAGFIGPGGALTLTGAVALAGFLGHWLLALIAAERAPRALESGGGRT